MTEDEVFAGIKRLVAAGERGTETEFDYPDIVAFHRDVRLAAAGPGRAWRGQQMSAAFELASAGLRRLSQPESSSGAADSAGVMSV